MSEHLISAGLLQVTELFASAQKQSALSTSQSLPHCWLETPSWISSDLITVCEQRVKMQ